MAARRTAPGRAAGKPAVGRGAADEAVERAHRAGAIGPHGSDVLRSLRDSAIIARSACGVPAREVAAEFGVAPRTVRAVLARARSEPSALDRAPVELLEELLGLHRRLLTDLLALAHAYRRTNAPVALGALKAAGAAADRFEALLERSGKLPDLDRVRGEAELLALADLMLAKVDEIEAGEASPAEVAEFIRQAIIAPGPLDSFGPEGGER